MTRKEYDYKGVEVPKLLKNESNKSFIARVKKWETLTGMKYPRSFSGKSSIEERVLNNEPRLFGLNVPVDYTDDPDWLDSLREQGLRDVSSLDRETQAEIEKEVALANARSISQRVSLQIENQKKTNKALEDLPKDDKDDNNNNNDKSRGFNVGENNNNESKKKEKKPADTTGWSTIHTIDPNTGEPVGVMTNAQRLKFEKKYYSDRKAENSFTGWKPDHERSKKNRLRLASIPKK